VALRHWASPLKLDGNRLSIHVLEAVDPASAILEFTRVNHVDHIILGAHQHSGLSALLGGVSGKVASGRSAPSPWCGRRGWQRDRSSWTARSRAQPCPKAVAIKRRNR